MTPGRNATRNFRLSDRLLIIEVVTQASSQCEPVGVSAASNPSCSALRVICPRYWTEAGLVAAAPATPCPLPTILRLSPPLVGRNQWNFKALKAFLPVLGSARGGADG